MTGYHLTVITLPNEILFIIHLAFLTGSLLFAGRLVEKYGLVLFSALMALFANLFVLKQVELCGLTLTPADPYALFSAFALNLIQQRYGNELARKTMTLNLMVLLLFALFSFSHLIYAPAPCDWANLHYTAILGVAPRLIAASIISFYLSQRLDVFIFSRLSAARFFVNRQSACMLLSASVAQTFDTLFFSISGLYGLVSQIVHIMGASLLIKIVAALFSTPAVGWIGRWIPRGSHA